MGHGISNVPGAIGYSVKQAVAVAEEAKQLATDVSDKVDAFIDAGGFAGKGSVIKVTCDSAFINCPYTVTSNGKLIVSGTVPEACIVTFVADDCSTIYTITVTCEGYNYSVNVETKEFYGQMSVTLQKFTATIRVSSVVGSIVTVTLGDNSYRANVGESGTVDIPVHGSGTYAVSAVYDDVKSKVSNVDVSENSAVYEVSVEFITLTVVAPVSSVITIRRKGV